jgi:hypothetical protein
VQEIPEIRIRFSPLLYRTISTRLFRIDKPGESLMPPEAARQKAMKYHAAWQLREKAILTDICALFDLTFYKPVIDVYLSPWIPSISAPILISMRATPDEFVDVLTHELLHVLITDNRTYTQEALGLALEHLYPHLDQAARDHVLVYAGLRHIYLDVIREPRRLDRDVAYCRADPSHLAAWNYVEEHGHLAVLDEFRNRYRQMADGLDSGERRPPIRLER